jgi:hypothetical protein
MIAGGEITGSVNHAVKHTSMIAGGEITGSVNHAGRYKNIRAVATVAGSSVIPSAQIVQGRGHIRAEDAPSA